MTSLGDRAHTQTRENMLDLVYVLIALAFFLLCWLFTKACDRL